MLFVAFSYRHDTSLSQWLIFILAIMYNNTSCRSADNSVRMFDRRNLTSGTVGSPIHKFEGHKAAVLCVQAGSFVLQCSFWNSYWTSEQFHNVQCNILSFNFRFFPLKKILFQWSPDRASVFGSAAEDGFLNIWDYEKVFVYCLRSHFEERLHAYLWWFWQ